MESKLNSKDILEKEFKTGLRGYNQDDVDQFLDDIIQDYETFEMTIASLKAENKRLHEELLDAPKRQVSSPSNGSTNFDILKRLSNLEKHVFGSKLYE
ncbi:MAG: cell division regulator GpsB [Planococcaceae bacterium]|uniref:cell division regulator GpsB n=1 Tax=Paenisporosarcina quisquiliarum TaxID=365346 RepID=UPI0024287208|nr:cell division regulator GpsB [Bacillota bacterium]MDX1771013.1 cell division regulator GpsB [Planococcaceae bacterium]